MRIFKIGHQRITETDGMKDKPVEEIQQILSKRHPEIKSAKILRRDEGDNTLIEFLPKPGRKG